MLEWQWCGSTQLESVHYGCGPYEWNWECGQNNQSQDWEWVSMVKGKEVFCCCCLFVFNIYLTTLGLSCSKWDLVPWPRIKPRLPVLGVWSLSHWPTTKVPERRFLKRRQEPPWWRAINWNLCARNSLTILKVSLYYITMKHAWNAIIYSHEFEGCSY